MHTRLRGLSNSRNSKPAYVSTTANDTPAFLFDDRIPPSLIHSPANPTPSALRRPPSSCLSRNLVSCFSFDFSSLRGAYLNIAALNWRGRRASWGAYASATSGDHFLNSSDELNLHKILTEYGGSNREKHLLQYAAGRGERQTRAFLNHLRERTFKIFGPFPTRPRVKTRQGVQHFNTMGLQAFPGSGTLHMGRHGVRSPWRCELCTHELLNIVGLHITSVGLIGSISRKNIASN